MHRPRIVLVGLLAAVASAVGVHAAAPAHRDTNVSTASGDGGTILFNSWAMFAPHLWYTVRPDGSGYRVLGATGPRIDWGLGRLSPDARMFLFDHANSLLLAASDGSHPRVLARAPRNSRIASFDWSPDGRHVAYGSPRGIWITNVRGTKRVLIVADRGRGIGAAVTWSPGGSRIAFLGRGKVFPKSRPRVYTSRLYVVRPDGSGLHALGDFLSVEMPSRISWSPDDRFLTVGASQDFIRSLVLVIDVRTGVRKALVRGGGPQFSPDGQRIAYFGPSGGLRMISSHGGRSRRVGPPANAFVWSPEGDQIAFGDSYGRLQVMNPDGSRRHQIARVRSGDVGREGPLQWTRG